MASLPLALLAAVLAAVPAAAEGVSVSSYTAAALAASPEVRQAEEAYRFAQWRYRRAVSDMALPTVAFSAAAYPYGDNPENGYQFNTWRLNRSDLSVNTTLDLNLFNSFEDALRVQSARAGRDAALKTWDAARQDRAYAAIEAYYRLAAADDLTAVARRSVEEQERQLAQSRDLYGSGHKSEADVLKSETDWRSSQLRLVAAESDRGDALVAFNALVDRPRLDDADLTLELSTAGVREPDAAAGLARALARRPELAAARKAVEQARADYRSALKGLLPTLRADATWNHTELANFGAPVEASSLGIPNPNYYLALSLSLPLGYNGLSQYYALAQARAARRAAQAAQAQADRQVRTEVSQAWVAFDRALRTYGLALQKVDIARKSLDLVSRQYAQGLADAVRMNQAQTDFLEASVSRAAALHDIFIGQARYRRAVGDPLW